MKTLQIGMGWFPEQPGGLNRFYYGCLQHLSNLDVGVKGLVAGSSQVVLESGGQVMSFASRGAPLPHRWWSIHQKIKTLPQQEYHIIASHFALYTLPILHCTRARPLVVHFHGPWALEGNIEGNRTLSTWCKKQIEQFCYNRASHFIVLSQAFQDVLHREYQIPLDRIHIVPGGVDPKQFHSSQSASGARQALGWPTDRPILLCVRRLAKRMGLENLIAAMDIVRRQHPDLLLLIAGKGQLKDTLERQISHLSLEHQVRLLGYLPDEQLPLAYRAANLSVVPTIALEGFGLIIIESLAAGTPVLGTPIGGIPEILRPLSDNLIFDSPRVNDLAAHINNVLSGDISLPSKAACQSYVEEHYAWSVVAQQIKTVYEKALV